MILIELIHTGMPWLLHTHTRFCRFALQQSFIINASTMHPKTIGKHKKMLRDLCHEWFLRRVARNVLARERLGLGDAFSVPKHMPHVSELDIASMLAGMHSLRREISPHWWFAACMH